MAKLLMISSNLTDDPYPVYPLGPNLVASAARKFGHEVRLIDLMVDGEDGLNIILDEFKPDYIAFSIRNVDNVNFSQPQSFIAAYRSIIKRIKEKTSVPIILGGAAFTIFPGQFLEYLGADYGIIGPGELSLPMLIGQIERHAPPKNPIINGEIDRSGINDYYLERESRLADFYLHKGGMLNIHTKRGCPHQCLYCSYPNLEGKQYVFRQPEAVVDEIIFLKNAHRADFIFFTDSVFNDAQNQYLLIIEEMARRGITIPWTCYFRPGKFHQDQVKLMKQTGLYAVEWGTDCASNVTLEGMRKNFCWEEVRQANNLFARHKIPGSHFIIFGGPGETPDTVREGIKNLTDLDYSVIFGGMGIRVFPNTGIYELAKKEGLALTENELFNQEVYYHSPKIEINWLNKFLTESFKGKRNWVYPWAGVAERNSFMHNSGLRGPLWDLLLKKA